MTAAFVSARPSEQLQHQMHQLQRAAPCPEVLWREVGEGSAPETHTHSCRHQTLSHTNSTVERALSQWSKADDLDLFKIATLQSQLNQSRGLGFKMLCNGSQLTPADTHIPLILIKMSKNLAVAHTLQIQVLKVYVLYTSHFIFTHSRTNIQRQ